MTRLVPFTALLLLYACAFGGTRAVEIAAGQHDCDYCHRNITELAFASQVVTPGQSARFFDDLQCLRGYLASVASPPADARIFVTDHRTSEWIPAETAVFSRAMTVRTPLGSHLLAHASVASRDSDAEAVRPMTVEPADVIAGAWRGVVASQ